MSAQLQQHRDRRRPTEVDRVAEAWVDALVAHDPAIGTYIGRATSGLADYSPEGSEGRAAAERSALAQLVASEAADGVDAVTRADLAAELRLSLARHDAGERLRDLNVIDSPAQQIRDVFDLMPTDSPEGWELVAARLRAVPGALTGYRASLSEGVSRGLVPAARQVEAVAAQALRTAGTVEDPGFFARLAASAGEAPAALSLELASAAAAASSAYTDLASFLERELAPHAPASDAFGRERYELASEAFLGARVDLDETYEWGLEELARMTSEQQRVAAEIVGGDPRPGIVAEAVAQLERDPARKLRGTDALQRWMQETSDRAVAELAGGFRGGREASVSSTRAATAAAQFDIPAEIRALECRIAPTREGGIYYTGPSDDLSRPGRMWWSVPEGVTEFDTWRELTTVYHEGVPGHHLQIGQAVVNRGLLNEWRRQLAGTSGHAEGWALYAERLMEQLGYLDDPADRLGMLDGQRMRAARVVLDIGVHLGKRRPDGAGVWDGEYAFGFMRDNVAMNDGFVRFEVLRYLGWGGQAPAYKVGQRIWEALRDEARDRAEAEGSPFDIRDFHREALALGGVRLDTLQAALRGELRGGSA
ncbi:DUF885 domain-containing protein [Leucobacter sp. wl10]|uniref:DUF885 domain-containing protein n=1 Tax=Leucobacter sp. wl10 TaxID=2304677 RepID=UPI000E5BD7EA|nr:DUF885 domain-containing protein [Leucobacter sp. wl10]RGE23799.1 DUF885 domain-containing protein [Leucobacter sp. wl10]